MISVLCLSAHVTDASMTSILSLARETWDLLRKRGFVDVYMGRRLRGLIEQLGFVDVGQEGVDIDDVWEVTLRHGYLNRYVLSAKNLVLSGGTAEMRLCCVLR